MKNACSWRKRFFLFSMIVLSMLFIIGCSEDNKTVAKYFDDDDDPGHNFEYAEIATESTIALGAVNPAVVVTATDFEFNAANPIDDLDVEVGTTGLTLDTFTYNSATQVTLHFLGTAATGYVTIELADYESDTLTIAVPHHIATTSTIGCEATDPTVTVTDTDFKADISAADLNVDVGTTGLTLDSVTYDSATQITLAFTGTAAAGRLTIQAKGSAFQEVADVVNVDSNTLFLGICDPLEPWNATATSAPWLSTNPINSKHDGGWVYSAREDVIYAIYPESYINFYLYRIDHIGQSSSIATTFNYGRHGSHPVIDDTGTYIYLPPSEETNQLERYNTVTFALETRAAAARGGQFSHGAWKNGKLWIVLNGGELYSYDPGANSWSGVLNGFGQMCNVASSGPASNLIYVIAGNGAFWSYDVTNGTITTLASHPHTMGGFGGNGMFTWFGHSIGFIYAAGGCGGTPAIYDIYGGAWHDLSDPRYNGNCNGHATYDTSRRRLYIVDGNCCPSNAFYYQY